VKIYIYSILVLNLILQHLNAQDVNVRAQFDTSRIFIGDQINYTVIVDQPAGIRLNVPSAKDTLFKSIEILSGPAIDTMTLENSRLRIISRYLVTSFDSGFYEVPPVYAEFPGETEIKRFYSDYAPLEVMRVNITPPDTVTRIFDIIGPYRAPLTIGEIIPWALLAALLAILLWAISRLMRRFKKMKPGYEPVVVKEAAHIIAFRDLEKLKEKKLWQKGEVKQYYSLLTEIIRQYLADRYEVDSLELTTSETLDELVRTGFKKDAAFIKLRDILNGADLVKFAKYRPDPSENELHFDNSWQFVDMTRQREEIKEEAEENSGKEVKE